MLSLLLNETLSGSRLIFVLVNINPWILTEYIVRNILCNETSYFTWSPSDMNA